MSILDWWRKRMGSRRRRCGSSRNLDEAAISARVDLVRLEAFAEAAYEAMRESRPQGARSRYEEARAHFDHAIDAAHRARLHDEVARLKRRRDQIGQVYNGQMRYSGDG
jgi:iron-sulfur cluster repair protein YtfE (RIC family)